MLIKFWETVGTGISKEFNSFLSASMIFWIFGILLSKDHQQIEVAYGKFSGFTPFIQFLILLGVLILLYVSNFIVRQLSLIVARILQGYWLPFFDFLKIYFIGWYVKRAGKKDARWQFLKQQEQLSLKDSLELRRLEHTLHYTPSVADNFMPTVLGNVIQAVHTQINEKYGLDVVICWPRLWPLLSQTLRDSIISRNKAISSSMELFTWGLLFVFWSYYNLWALPVVLICCVVNYRIAIQHSKAYGDLLHAAFDLHRWDLYRTLHYKMPGNQHEEVLLGRSITRFLWRGEDRRLYFYKH